MTAPRAAPGRRVRIRAARLADAPAIARVMRAAVRAAPGPYRATERAAWGSLPALYHRWAMTAGGEAYLVAERGGRIVGYGAVLSRGLGARVLRGLRRPLPAEQSSAGPHPAWPRPSQPVVASRSVKGLGAPSPPGRGWEITAAFVSPAHAGRGVGAALVARLLGRARRGGVGAVVVDAAAGAVPFYARLGFRGGRAIRVPLPGGRTLPARRMRLAL